MLALVEEFVDGMTRRVGELREAYEQQDTQRLRLLAHRLRGTSASYGYADLSVFATTMEKQIAADSTDEFPAWIETIQRFQRAATRGLKASQSAAAN